MNYARSRMELPFSPADRTNNGPCRFRNPLIPNYVLAASWRCCLRCLWSGSPGSQPWNNIFVGGYGGKLRDKFA